MTVNMTAAIERKISERERPLMEATLRIIGRTGVDGVTHRAVAAEAGMSVGAVTHHFETREVLVDAALRFALTREMNRLRALAFSLQSKAFDPTRRSPALTTTSPSERKTEPAPT